MACAFAVGPACSRAAEVKIDQIVGVECRPRAPALMTHCTAVIIAYGRCMPHVTAGGAPCGSMADIGTGIGFKALPVGHRPRAGPYRRSEDRG